MADDVAAFKTDDDELDPPDGEHTAYLERTSVFESQAGDTWIRTCWRTTDLAYYWESLNGVVGRRKPFTRKLLEGLGVRDDDWKTWDDLNDVLAGYEGGKFRVGVEHNGSFLNTEVYGRADSFESDIPADTVGLPEVSPEPVSTGGLFDDDDVPF